MAVMQTPHGRVIGLILQKVDQPKAEASEKAGELPAAAGTSSVTPRSGATPSPKGKAVGRTAKK